MPKNFYDTEDVPFRAPVTGGPSALKVKTVDFVATVIKKDGSRDAKPPSSQPTRNSMSGEVSAIYNFKEPVPDDHDFYDVECKASFTVPNKPKSEVECEAVRVWPAEVEIKFTSDKPENLKNVKFSLSGQPKTSSDSGSWKGKAPLSPYNVELKPPWTLSADPGDKTSGRKRQYKITRAAAKAVILRPPPGKEVEEVINFALGTLEWDLAQPFGNQLEVEFGTEESKGNPGDRFYIEVTFAAGSARNNPVRTLLPDGGVQNITSPNATTRKGEILLGPDRKARFKVELGKAGGDKCTIKVGSTPACNDGDNAKLEVKNIRRITYQIGQTNEMGALDIKQAVAALKNVSVNYRISDIVRFNPPSRADNQSWFDANKIVAGARGLFLCIGTHNIAQFQTLYPNAVRAQESRLIFCDFQFDDGGDAVKNHDISAGDKATVDLQPLADIDPDDDPALLTHNLVTGAKAASASWSTRDAGPALGDDIPADNLTIDYANNQNNLRVTLPQEARQALVAGRLLRIRTQCHYAVGPYNGWSTATRTIVIAVRNSSGVRPPLEWNKTIVHEVGHMMNMVMNVNIPNMNINTHGRAYNNARGGLGTHCADNVSQPNWNSGGTIRSDWDPTCVMFHAGRAQKRIDFCNRCKPFVLGQDLSALA